MDSSSKLCQICRNADFKYTCPKCNTTYCSVDCYRAPSHQQCSEVFYRDCVTTEMATRSTGNLSPADPETDDDIKRMYNILKRMEAGEDVDDNEGEIDSEEILDSDDEPEETDLASRLDGVNLEDPDAVWQCLTCDEQQEFQTLLKTGEISNILPPFLPWWDIKIPHKLIEDLDNKSEPVKFKNPQLLEKIPLYETLTNKPPSSCLPNNLYNILSAYTCTVRYFNGEHFSSAYESAKHLVSNSATLNKNANFDDTEQAVKSVMLESDSENVAWKFIATDVEKIIEGPYEEKRSTVYVLSALSDIYRLVGQAKRSVPKKGDGIRSASVPDYDEIFDRRKLNLVVKKIEYFLAFVSTSEVVD